MPDRPSIAVVALDCLADQAISTVRSHQERADVVTHRELVQSALNEWAGLRVRIDKLWELCAYAEQVGDQGVPLSRIYTLLDDEVMTDDEWRKWREWRDD